jgi:hypothetical protein
MYIVEQDWSKDEAIKEMVDGVMVSINLGEYRKIYSRCRRQKDKDSSI